VPILAENTELLSYHLQIKLQVTAGYKCLKQHSTIFYVVRAVHFGMNLYNDQRNAQVFNLSVYLLLPYMFWAFL
jgi:hypothetical protein